MLLARLEQERPPELEVAHRHDALAHADEGAVAGVDREPAGAAHGARRVAAARAEAPVGVAPQPALLAGRRAGVGAVAAAVELAAQDQLGDELVAAALAHRELAVVEDALLHAAAAAALGGDLDPSAAGVDGGAE